MFKKTILDSLLKTKQSKSIRKISTTPKVFKKEDINVSSLYVGLRQNAVPTPLRPQHNGEWPKITLFGDSITRYATDIKNGCWVPMLQHKVGDYFDVDSRGFPGYNSRNAVSLLSSLFPSTYLQRVELFVEFFGHNDSWENQVTSIDPEEYQSNTRQIIDYLLANGLTNDKIILVTPAWFDAVTSAVMMKVYSRDPSIDFGKSLEHAQKYCDIKLKLAKEYNITSVDMFKVTTEYSPIKDLYYDGVHFTKKGAKLVFNELMPVVRQKIASNFGKPLSQLIHAQPFENLPGVKEFLNIEEVMKGLPIKPEDE